MYLDIFNFKIFIFLYWGKQAFIIKKIVTNVTLGGVGVSPTKC